MTTDQTDDDSARASLESLFNTVLASSDARDAVDTLDAYRDELIPAWEAVYEPGNVSDYLIGYTNAEAPAKAAAEAWFRSEYGDEIGRLEWTAQRTGDQHDAWYDLTHIEPDGAETGPGITVRHRTAR